MGKVTSQSQTSGGSIVTPIDLLGNAVVSATEPGNPTLGMGWLDTTAGAAQFTPIREVSADYTATAGDFVIWVDASGGAVTITLPQAAQNIGRHYMIKKFDSSGNTVTIDGNGSETIDGSETQVISAQFSSAHIVSNGAKWGIV